MALVDVTTTWTRITGTVGTGAKVTFKNESGVDMEFRAKSGSSLPLATEPGLNYPAGTGEMGVTLVDFMPGAANADNLFARVVGPMPTRAQVFCSHA